MRTDSSTPDPRRAMGPSAVPCVPRRDGGLEGIRRDELGRAVRWFPPGATVLELGGGSGLQAAHLRELGFRVRSLDIDLNASRRAALFPVERYDGMKIPAEDGSADVVFSSNVLEHVERLDVLLAETRRVMAPGGIAVHLVPSAVWRFWTSLAYYPHRVRQAACFLRDRIERRAASRAGSGPPGAQRPVGLWLLSAGPHGVDPTALHELWTFSRRRWSRLFRELGFRQEAVEGAGLFYSGFGVCPGLSLETRRRLARWLGSSCTLFVLRRGS